MPLAPMTWRCAHDRGIPLADCRPSSARNPNVNRGMALAPARPRPRAPPRAPPGGLTRAGRGMPLAPALTVISAPITQGARSFQSFLSREKKTTERPTAPDPRWGRIGRESLTRGKALARAPPPPAARQTSATIVTSAAPTQRSVTEEGALGGVQEQLALVEPDHLRRLEQPLRWGFADRTTARKGLEVAAGFAIADRLGTIRQTAGSPIGRHGYMLIVWLGSRWLQLEQPGASAVPFTQYRLLRDFGWGDAGKPAPQALPPTLLGLQEARWEGDVNDPITGHKTHEDHFGIIDPVLWPLAAGGRLERPGYIFLGSWVLEQLRHEAGAYLDWAIVRDLPPIARELYGLLD